MEQITTLNRWRQGEFVEVKDTQADLHYGGYQGWLSSDVLGDKKVSEFYINRSCGVTAGNNVAVYLSENYKEYFGLFPYKEVSFENYVKNMRVVYRYLRPRLWGIPTLLGFGLGYQRFAGTCGIGLKAHYKRLLWVGTKEEDVVDFIKAGLEKNRPVLLLTWNVSVDQLKDLKNHWITITAIYRKQGQWLMVTSNWGKQRTYNLSQWIKMNSFYKGLIYFE